MNSPGIRLELRIGKNVPEPVPLAFAEAVQEVEVTHTDEGRSGFQITFQASRGGSQSQMDYPLLEGQLLDPFNRVIMIVTLGATPYVLMDGIITHHQLLPDEGSGETNLVITGEDVSVMMDLEEKSVEHPGMDESTIANLIITASDYSPYGMIAKVERPSVTDTPDVNERTPVQQCTDLEYLQQMAERYGFVFYVTPGPNSGKNTAYWGPPKFEGQPQKALSVNMGPSTNVERINFQYNALSPTIVSGNVQDRSSNDVISMQNSESERPQLAGQGPRDQSHIRTVLFRQTGLNANQATGRIQGMTDASVDQAATAEGELDALDYQGLLWPHKTVGVRGAGRSYDGLWYVKSVTHVIRIGEYKQRFTLSREGRSSTIERLNA